MLPGNQSNVEYWFRLLYDCIHGACYGGLEGFSSFLAHLWLWIIFIGYALSIIGLLVIVYCTVRIFELRKREHEYYSTVITPPGSDKGTNARWEHIQTLIEGKSPSEWKEAIIEADIMLNDALKEKGYVGDGVGERLRGVDSKQLKTLQNAWEAHKVRNQIAHEGSAFTLSDMLARRTIQHYQSVLLELKAI